MCRDFQQLLFLFVSNYSAKYELTRLITPLCRSLKMTSQVVEYENMMNSSFTVRK